MKKGFFNFTWVFMLFLSLSSAANEPMQVEASSVEGPADTLKVISATLDRLEERVSSRKTTLRTTDWSWEDLEKFQRTFWRAMALDPANLDDSLIPEDHHPRLLNEVLRGELNRLYKARSVAELYNAADEFDEYVRYCDQLLEWRDQGQFQKARVEVKKGELEGRFLSLVEKMSKTTGVNLEVGMVWNEGDRTDILGALTEVKSELARVGHVRVPASAISPANPNLFKTVFWIVVPLVFICGFVGGLIFRKRPSNDRGMTLAG